MRIMASLLTKQARISATKTLAVTSPSSSSFSLMYRLLSSSSTKSLSSSSSSTAVSGTAAATDAVADGVDLTAITKPSVTISSPLQPGVVIYDGVCHLCHHGVKWVIKADKYRKIKFCCVQSKAAEPYMKLCGLDREDVLHRFLFVEGLGSYYQGSTAALKVMSHLPFPYSALSSLMIIPTPLREAVYDYVAKRRYDWFGKEEDCIVLQEKEMLERFVDRDEMMGQ